MSTVKTQAARSIVANASSIAEKAIKAPGPVIGKVKAKPATVPTPVKAVVKAPEPKVVPKPVAKVIPKPAVKVVPKPKPKVAPAVKTKAPVKVVAKKAVAPDVIAQAKAKLAQAVDNITKDTNPGTHGHFASPPATKIQNSGPFGQFAAPFSQKFEKPASTPAPASGKPLSWAEVSASMKTAGHLKP